MKNNDTSWIDELYRQRDAKEKAAREAKEEAELLGIDPIVVTLNSSETFPIEKQQMIAKLKAEIKSHKKAIHDKVNRLQRLLK